MLLKKKMVGMVLIAILGLLAASPTGAKVQYSNDFENPASDIVATAWPEWWPANGADISARAVNGRVEWDDSSSGNQHWLALDMELPMDFVVEFDFFYDSRTNGRFSFWPLAPATVEGATIFSHHNYFMRKNTHYFNGSDTIPSEGPRDLTQPEGSTPHRLRFEVSGDHVVFLYKVQGEGPWVKIDERDFPPFGDEIRNIQLGFNKDGGGAAGGIQYIDNLEVSYDDPPLDYSSNFDDPSSELPPTAWPEWIDSGGNTARAVNGRIEWYDSSGGNNNWLRLNVPVYESYYMEFDFFYDARTNGRFSVWPRAQEGATIFNRHNYFIRKNTHYFNGSDTIPSEGPRDMTLPEGSVPHRLRFEVTGDHVVFLYKDQGEGPWIKVDERDFPPFGDGVSYVQLGMNKDGGGELGGVHYIDNFELHDFGSSEVTVERFIDANDFTAEGSVPVRLELAVAGPGGQIVVTELLPERWIATDISNDGILEDGLITWTLTDISEATTLTYNAVAPALVADVIANFSGAINGARIEGETIVEFDLPYLFREAMDYNFSGSSVDGKNYPMGTEKGVPYAEGLDGVLSSQTYFYPGWDVNEFVFPADEDYHFSGSGTVRGGDIVYDYRDPNEINITSVPSDTTSMGINGLAAGDWFRYTFDFGEGKRVLFANYYINTWNIGDEGWVDVYLDNQRIAETAAPATIANSVHYLTAGPVAVDGGVHDLVIAFPDGAATPVHFARLEVILNDGIGSVTRSLPDPNSLAADTPVDVSLKAEALLGTVTIEIEETIPEGATISDISDDGVLDGNVIRWVFDTMDSSQDSEKTVTYKATPADGVDELNFQGIAGVGKALAEAIGGDNVVRKPVEN